MIHVYYPNNNTEHETVLHAMHEGIAKSTWEHELQWLPITEYRVGSAPDIAVIFGVDKYAVEAGALRGRVQVCQRRLGKRTLVIEKGYFRRNEYYAVGWEGLNGRADFRVPVDVGPERRIAQGMTMLPVQGSHDEVLLVGQVPWDASVQDSSHLAWLRETTGKLQTITTDQIRLRRHPLGPSDMPGIIGILDEAGRPLADDLAAARVVITFNSNVAVDAILAGVPVIAMDEGSMAWGVVPHRLEYAASGMESALMGAALQQWMNELAWKQWNLGEMSTGQAWEHITRDMGLRKRKIHHTVQPKDSKYPQIQAGAL